MRSTRFSAGHVTHSAVSPNVRLLQLAGMRISATTTFCSGSMRESVVLLSVKAQILSALAAIDGATLPVPTGNFLVTLPVLVSTRESVLSPQVGTQRLVKAEMPPPHGLLIPAMGSVSLFALASILSRTSFSELGMSGESAKMIHGGATENSASAFRLAYGICTPGVLIPSLGSAGEAAVFPGLPG